MTLPLATSPGRSGFGPELGLSYDSGAGNGPFGFGWNLALPAITRKTDKGLPRYRDADESDVFVLSGAEDLVPVLDDDGRVYEDTDRVPGYTIHRYRPRVEGLFARIERWTRDSDGDTHWRSISRDNLLSIYGRDSNSRIADPDDPTGRTFSWLICETRDDRGNAVVYEYKPEDGAGVDLSRSCERHRGSAADATRTAQRYIKYIRYGNRRPLLNASGTRPHFLSDLPPAQLEALTWMFEVVFDYGEHDADDPRPSDPGEWTYRSDPFSTYRVGFEVRTTRLCRRVLMFHHFQEEAGVGADCLVRSTDFRYSHQADPFDERNPVYTFLTSITQCGYRRDDGGYVKRSLPSVELEYSRPVVEDVVHEVDVESLENLPIGVDGASFQWTDLYGEGIPGILTEQGGGWFYKRNVSPLAAGAVELSAAEGVARRPNVALARGARFMDLAGDGLPDVVVLEGPTPGFYERDLDESWEPFRPFGSRVARSVGDPNARFVDLTGDGYADLLITEDDTLVWHPSLAEEGFGPAERIASALDDDRGPRVVFADGSQSVHLADLSGDGLADLVRIRNGEVCYWPSLGYGRFGPKVTMDFAPWFDHPDHFDQRRIRLADIDGSGTTDIIYLHRGGVRLYFNQSGNGWSSPYVLPVAPDVAAPVDVSTADLLGNGTACLVWSSRLPGDANRAMRYVNLMGDTKPHLLVRVVNNLGAETRVQYAPSTKFYLQDLRDGRPWITRLPFPVHVVERVETHDHVSRNRFVTRSAYHHGYFDGEEREFRGFGMVEQWDTEELAALTARGELGDASNLDASSHVPPALTKTWFHTGVYVGGDHVSDFFAGLLDGQDRGEYYREPGLDDSEARARLLEDTILPPGLTADEEREACRALKGMMLRQEVYALDGTEKEPHPYVVIEQNSALRVLQRRGPNRHAVFFAHGREALTVHYERNPTDPRVQHAITLEVDRRGNVTKEASIGYGRREADHTLPLQSDRDRQGRTLITYIESDFTNAVDDVSSFPFDYRTPLPAASRTYELTGYDPPATTGRLSAGDLVAPDPAAGAADMFRLRFDEEIPYEADPGPGRQRRLIEHTRARYRPDDLGASANDAMALLPPGDLQALALAGESYTLVLTPGLIDSVFSREGEPLLPDPAAVVGGAGGDRGGYVDLDSDGHWWSPSGRVFLSGPADDTPVNERETALEHFLLPRRFQDPFGATTTVRYDEYDLLVLETEDAVHNKASVGERDTDDQLTSNDNDYRVLQPALVSDANRNRSAVAFDALGLVVGTAVMGKPEEDLGDSLIGFEPDVDESVLLSHLNDPLADSLDFLGNATTRIAYDPHAYHRTRDAEQPKPPVAYTLSRETHVAELEPEETTRIRHAFSYADGLGRAIQQKVQAEPGPVEDEGPDVDPRWVGTGWTVFNNKGKPVRQYEPFFDDTHQFRVAHAVGVSPILFYDPVERLVAKLHPNHTWEKVVFGPWRQESWDVNDTVTREPQDDEDVKGFFVHPDPDTSPRLPAAEYLPTWYALRIDPAHAAAASQRWPDTRTRQAEKIAAQKAAVHAETPTVTHADSLGRTCLTVAHNKFRYGKPLSTEPPTEESYETRVVYDIAGNEREVIDAKHRVVMRYHYDMLGNRIHQASMEAGERWTLNDVAGNPIRAWDSRGHAFRTEHDSLRRPTGSFLSEGTAGELLVEHAVYGESRTDPQIDNLRGQVIETYDQAGVATSDKYDFKGNLLRSQRQLAQDYKTTLDWSTAVPLETETFTSRTAYDALSRPIQLIAPRSDQPGSRRNVIQPGYNEANLLERVDVWLDHPTNPPELIDASAIPPAPAGVSNIDYDAKGQRTLIEYRNGAKTRYEYDPLTFRLIRLRTTRRPGQNGVASQLFSDPTVVQDLRYTFDPAGNITHIEDAALKTVFHNNEQVEPVSSYTYDAIYRLIEAAGREHIGQTAHDFSSPDCNRRDYPFVGHRAHPNDLQALRNYTELYAYDAVGNFETMRHVANGGSWTRQYDYEEDSLVEGGKKSNRLTRTRVGNGLNHVEHYSYLDVAGKDGHGCITAINGMGMVWDFRDQLQRVDIGGCGTAYYVYDAGGQRVRKVIETQNGAPRQERIYLGGFEIFQRHGSNALVRETLHIMDDQQRIALVDTRTQGNEPDVPAQLIRCQLSNHLGSASLELDDRAHFISCEEYTPYGSTSYQAGRSGAEVSLKRYRYTGKERDEETGLYYHGARYYAPWLGRWTAADPSGMVDGPALYAYSRGSPVLLRDANGRQTVIRPGTAAQRTADYGGLIELQQREKAGEIYGPTQEPQLRPPKDEPSEGDPAPPEREPVELRSSGDPEGAVSPPPRLAGRQRWTKRRLAAVHRASEVYNRAQAAQATIDAYLNKNLYEMAPEQLEELLARRQKYQALEQAAVLTMRVLDVQMVDREGPVLSQGGPTHDQILSARWTEFNRRVDALKASVAAGPLTAVAEVKSRLVHDQSITASDMDTILAAAAVVDIAIAAWAFRRGVEARKHGKAGGARGGAEAAVEHAASHRAGKRPADVREAPIGVWLRPPSDLVIEGMARPRSIPATKWQIEVSRRLQRIRSLDRPSAR